LPERRYAAAATPRKPMKARANMSLFFIAALPSLAIPLAFDVLAERLRGDGIF